MKGRLFGVGVGPGDPELMTYKAVRTIEKCPVIAVPAKGREHAVSYRIAAGMVDNMEEKEYLDLDTPMTKDRQILNQNYEKAAKRIIEELEKGKDVAYLTLGDPTIYSTYMYIQRIIKEKGYETSIINGIPSFCAAASKLNESLADRADALRYPGTKVLMKSASRLAEVREILEEKNVDVKMIENCGMADEQIYERLEDIPEHASYYSLLIVKESV